MAAVRAVAVQPEQVFPRRVGWSPVGGSVGERWGRNGVHLFLPDALAFRSFTTRFSCGSCVRCCCPPCVMMPLTRSPARYNTSQISFALHEYVQRCEIGVGCGGGMGTKRGGIGANRWYGVRIGGIGCELG